MKFRHLIYSSAIFLLLTAAYTAAGGDDTDLTVIPATKQGTVSGLWLDRGHPEARQLLPNTTVVVAELAGPAVITNLRITTDQWMHSERAPRGLVLEIYFDGAAEPAVMSPLPDFFADGSNGRAMNFSSRYLEKVPTAYNCYFRMPFRKSAKVHIRNDTAYKYMGYSMVEWEAQPNLDANTGYFHATWRRKGFYVTGETREEFFRVKGRGHVIGRQFRIATREPKFSELYVFERGVVGGMGEFWPCESRTAPASGADAVTERAMALKKSLSVSIGGRAERSGQGGNQERS